MWNDDTVPVPQPIAADPPGVVPRPWLTQWWLDLAFLHWAVEPRRVAPLLPRGVVPDTLYGTTYVGLIAFRMHRIGWFGLPGIPYLGTFPETNVRLYSVDAQGRRGVVFRSLDASRLLPVVIARAGLRLPYQWSRMAIRARGDVISYAGSRRWPGPRGACSRIAVRIGERVEEPSELEHFLTARWGMHNTFLGRVAFLPNFHQRWPLHRASLLRCEENLVAAAGLPGPLGEPVSVLYSPGVRVRFGRPDGPRDHRGRGGSRLRGA
ncbi:hypothetical protein BS35_000799 [Actinomadura glauciflava]|nr:hypothetical protein [Actinomadura glauciflava]